MELVTAPIGGASFAEIDCGHENALPVSYFYSNPYCIVAKEFFVKGNR